MSKDRKENYSCMKSCHWNSNVRWWTKLVRKAFS